MSVSYSNFAKNVRPEGAFEVLAVAKRLISQGKEVFELEIGDSPFPTPAAVREAGIKALNEDRCHYGPSAGIDEFRVAASDYVNHEFGLDTNADNIIAGPGAKTFQLLFAEAFLNANDGVLVFSPYFPTYSSHIGRRNARMVLAPLSEKTEFRPDIGAVQRFIESDPSPKAIFLNSPHNPTGGVATQQDLGQIADLVRGSNVAIFSDEPYDQMVWKGQHHSIFAEPDMADHVVAAYTFSKSFSMSGWRLGFAVANAQTIRLFETLTNTVISCVPPFTQAAGVAALTQSRDDRDAMMAAFEEKLIPMVAALNDIEDVECLSPAGSFYVFPNVKKICNLNNITSHGLAMYLLEGADTDVGVACLGGECFGEAGGGYMRLSSSLAEDKLLAAISFIKVALSDRPAIGNYLSQHKHYDLEQPYPLDESAR